MSEQLKRNQSVYYRSSGRFYPAVFIAQYDELPNQQPVRLKIGEEEAVMRRDEVFSDADRLVYEEKQEKDKYERDNISLIQQIKRGDKIKGAGMHAKMKKLKRLGLI